MSKPQDNAQRQQVLDVSQSFIVQAPAGSGKTSLLTLRFLHLLTIVNNPEEILAITFTKKAAAEMHQRIIESIKLATKPCPDAEFEAQTWALATQVLQRDADCEWHLLQNPNRLRVQTIDSMCAHLTKQMPVTARFGSPPSIQQDARNLYTEAARSCLNELENDDVVGEAIRVLLVHVDNQLIHAEGLISTMLASRDQWLRHVLSGESASVEREVLEAVLTRTVETVLDDIAAGFTQQQLETLAELLQFAVPNFEDRASNLGGLADVLEDGLDLSDTSAGALPVWLALGDFLLTEKDLWRKRADANLGFPAQNSTNDKGDKALFKEKKKQFKELLLELEGNAALTQAIAWLRCLPNPNYSDQQWQIIQALLIVLPQAVAHLRLVFQQQGCVDFCEVSLSASHALQDASGMTDVGLKLDYQLQHMLVDEFQDTSETQFMLLKDLVAGWQADDGRTLFLVGDPMQSIYRFRQAEVGLFLKTQEDGLGEVRAITPVNIAVNFRSQQLIVDWVNRAFSEVMPPVDNVYSGAISYKPSVPFKTEGVGEMIDEAVQYHPYESRVDEGQGLLALIQQIKHAAPDETIGVLVRGRKSLTELVASLNESGVPYQATDIDPLNTRQTVIDLMSLTRAYLHPADRIAWLSVLRAPWCALSLDDMHRLLAGFPDENISDLLHDSDSVEALSQQGQAAIGHVIQAFGVALRHRDRLSVADSIRGLWERLFAPECLSSPADLADCERFFECLATLERERESINLSDLQEQVEKLYAAPDVSAGNTLQIMTIHKAKGLEFDHVILPGLDRQAGNDEKRLLAWLERPSDTPGESELMIAPIKETGADEDDKIAKYLNRVEKDKARHESERLLYVAATRAKKQLHLSFCLQLDEKTDEPKTPASNTLLGLLWPTIKDEVVVEFNNDKIDEENNISYCYINQLNINIVDKVDYSDLDYQHQVNTTIQPQTNLIEFDWATDLAASVGTVCHQWMQCLGECGELDFDNNASQQQAIQHQLQELGVLPKDIKKAAARAGQILSQCVKDKRGQWVLNKQHEDSEFELAMSGVIEGSVVNYRLDRTFVDEGVRWIVDYKTSRHDDDNKEEFLDAEMKRYKTQLEHYATLMSAVDSRPIKLGLYYPAFGGWRSWDYTRA